MAEYGFVILSQLFILLCKLLVTEELFSFSCLSSGPKKKEGKNMSNLGLIIGLLVLLLNSTSRAVAVADDYSRNDFPPSFIFGSGTTAYQVEGAAMEDGRTPSIWDTFAHSGDGPGGNGDVTCDEYHKYKEDVKLMVDVGLDAYRFSISWSRLIPNGRGAINPKGLEYYNNLINELISHGIQPHVTLHNFDLPQALEDEYGGWVSPKIIDVHHLLEKLNALKETPQLSLIWLCIIVYWLMHQLHLCITKTTRILHPLVFGEYPKLMRKNAGSRLPIFTKAESSLVKGSAAFIGIIHYQNWHVIDDPQSLMMENRDLVADVGAKMMMLKENVTTPESLQRVIEYLKQVYGNPPTYVYENGLQMKRTSLLEDVPRVEYMHGYIGAVLDALRNGSNVKGYFTWSFLDVFELLDGYHSSYGLFYVDLNDPNLKRYPKLSARWYSNFLKGKATF